MSGHDIWFQPGGPTLHVFCRACGCAFFGDECRPSPNKYPTPVDYLFTLGWKPWLGGAGPVSKPSACECGAAKLGITAKQVGHSRWCPVSV